MPWFAHEGFDIHYKDSGSGVPVLLLPGITDSISNHKALSDRLASHYRVIAADLPGSGRSKPQPRRFHPGYYDDDARLFIALLRKLELPRVHLVGFSDGGEVALLMAVFSPGLIRSVLTWGAAGAVSDPEGRIVSAFRGLWDNPVAGFQDYRDHLAAIYGEPVGRETTQSFADAWEAIAAAGGDISRGRADQIACAVLLIFGENDFFISRALVNDLASRIAGCEVIEVEAAGHGVHEDRPDWFAKTVVEWLDRH